MSYTEDTKEFTSFTFNGVSSETLGITRVSDGSRYSDLLLPSFTDQSAQIPGGDGAYFFGSRFSTNKFNLNFAYDKLTDVNRKALKDLFADNLPHEFYFEEDLPAHNITHQEKIIYYVKAAAPIELKDICFVENIDGIKTRIYKGEGSVSLIGYDPFGYGILNTDSSLSSSITINNVGELECDYTVKFIESGSQTTGSNIYDSLSFKVGDNLLNISGLVLKSGDNGFQLNTKKHLIEGINTDGELTGTLYNQYITSGDFYKIPINSNILQLPVIKNYTRTLTYRFLYR